MSQTISKDSVKRLIKDIKQIHNEPLHSQGIYYKHDEEDMLKGYALLIGPKDTPYEYGNYLFEFDFPTDYPYSPPKLNFLTRDGVTRFNPNLYRNGKVCLSLLNTWRGEQWTSCQNISTILLTLLTIFNNNPLLNEPGINEKHRELDIYNQIITYKNIDVAICNIVTNEGNNLIFDKFYDEIQENFQNNYSILKKKINLLKKEKKSTTLITGIYNMNITINYSILYKKINLIHKNI